MGFRMRSIGWLAAAVVAWLPCVVWASPAAAVAVPSVRLFATLRRVTVTQNALRFGAADLGLWIGSTGGNFQIDVTRPGYGAWRAAQVDAGTGARLRSIPAALIDPAGGLARFLSVRFVDAHGRTAARRAVTFCPDGQASRVNNSGPLNSTYVGFCGNQGDGFPFLRGEVWGINSGWAVAPSLGPTSPFGFPVGPLPPGPIPFGIAPPGAGWVSLKPGRYTAVIGIAGEYRHLFAIPARMASVALGMNVLYSRPPAVRPPVRPPHRGKPEDAYEERGPRRAATLTAPDPATMPNLVAAPAWQIAVRRQRRRDVLTFNATIWNAGPAQFSIEGFRRPNSDLMDAYEYFFDASGNVVGRAPAGTLAYDSRPGHHHWHLQQLASYALLGRSRTIMSQKQSFCIAPSDAVDLTVPGAQGAQVAFGGLGFGGSVCDIYSPGAIWLREQLPAGWGDTYQQSVAGQAFDITHVPNGIYKIAVRVNPLGRLHETSTRDDVAYRQVRLLGSPGHRRVTVSPWHGING